MFIRNIDINADLKGKTIDTLKKYKVKYQIEFWNVQLINGISCIKVTHRLKNTIEIEALNEPHALGKCLDYIKIHYSCPNHGKIVPIILSIEEA